jgi:hypothetical protein
MKIPWKKRLKTTPNDVRRAWLLAAPFVLLGASKAEADTAFARARRLPIFTDVSGAFSIAGINIGQGP